MNGNTNNKTIINQKEKLTFKKFFQYIWWSIKFNTSVAPFESIILLVVKILFDLSPIVTSLAYARVYAKLAEILINKVPFDLAIKDLTSLLIIVFGIDIVLSILSIFRTYLNRKLSRIRRNIIENRFITKYSQLSSEQLDSPKLVSVLKRAEDNIWRLEGINEDIMNYIAGTIGGVTSVAIMLQYQPIIVLIAMVLIIPIIVKDILYNKTMKDISDESTEGWREYWTGRWFLTNKYPLIELRVQNLTKKLVHYLSSFRDKYTQKQQFVDTKYSKIDAIGRFNQVYSVLGTILIIRKVIQTGGDIGTVTFYINQIDRINNFFGVLIRDIVYLYDQMRYVRELKDFFDLSITINNGVKKIKIKQPPTIVFENVSFKYPNTDKYSIRNLNLTILPNEEIALVGENGAGKSTLIKLLLRFYDPTEGRILINGIDLRELDIESYYENISALFQDYNYIGFLTLKENIEYAKSKHSNISYEKAARMSDIHKAIIGLPKKYDTKSYSYFDGGVDLSQGQSQKLVIARAFYRNAPILILDEPTASIDAVSEAKIFDRIYKFMNNKTVIIISHRFSTVRNAKKIYVLDKGKIVESGSHEELLKVDGLYKKSFDLQAKGYSK